MKKLRLGFIGGGINSAVGNTHKIALEMDSRWEIFAGCFSKNDEINKKTAELWDVNNLYSNWYEMLEVENGNLDALCVLTPTNLHYEMIKNSLDLNYSVISEKSITNEYGEALELLNIQKSKNAFLTVINNYTGYPMMRELKHIVSSGKLGKIKHLQVEMPQEGFIKYNVNGKKPNPQEWRLSDKVIPTIYLDLAVHLYHILEFICGVNAVEICTNQNSYGFFKDVVDNVSCLVKYEDDIDCQIWFSKSSLGNRNGLKVRIYGDKGSVEWLQIDSEVIKFSDKYGKIQIVDRASPEIKIANQARYNRFKSGHPAGFIEAFANYYYDIADALSEYKSKKSYNNSMIISPQSAIRGMKFLDAMSKSAEEKCWVKI